MKGIWKFFKNNVLLSVLTPTPTDMFILSFVKLNLLLFTALFFILLHNLKAASTSKRFLHRNDMNCLVIIYHRSPQLSYRKAKHIKSKAAFCISKPISHWLNKLQFDCDLLAVRHMCE